MAVATSPEMASLNVSSLSFGIFPMLEKRTQWKHDWEPELLETARDIIAHVRPSPTSSTS